ncbi:hypothetical protein M406DRAFT_67015 [Cryphonectria parasitica EP155]|uniref:Uncharacterized protein n=1 Tax=Cryphonectria parasitica (strain ATCC 38755 / EP155) TaxID=660469 RepID=A0A9P5CTR7_CRYP1|nr:uncharacterized protein M406DRAFT_67015 [Cryphonectria parasitica EP155]KAF3770628.1 hypothetical protein M406DRAFT_67015 [Cryphonectria parasitica EP155]
MGCVVLHVKVGRGSVVVVLLRWKRGGWACTYPCFFGGWEELGGNSRKIPPGKILWIRGLVFSRAKSLPNQQDVILTRQRCTGHPFTYGAQAHSFDGAGALVKSGVDMWQMWDHVPSLPSGKNGMRTERC